MSASGERLGDLLVCPVSPLEYAGGNAATCTPSPNPKRDPTRPWVPSALSSGGLFCSKQARDYFVPGKQLHPAAIRNKIRLW